MAENDINCAFFFFFSSRSRPPPRTTPKNPNIPHHFVQNSSVLNINGPECPERFHHPKLTKVLPASRRTLAETIFVLTPAGASFLFLCFSPGATFSPPLSTFSAPLSTTLGHWPIDRSLDRSIARSIARSLDRSVARSLGRSIARSLGRSFGLSIARLFGRSLGRSIA